MARHDPFTGSLTALVTPFKQGKIDERAFQGLIDWQIRSGTDGLVVCGTTGESPTLSDRETVRLFNLAVEAANRRVQVIAGCGSNSTRHAVHLTRMAKKAQVDAALSVVPYYNKPTQEGLYQHFKAVADATDLPVLIYNIPGRCIVDMHPDTQKRLSGITNICGVKDSSGDLTRVAQTQAMCGKDFLQLSGEDALILPFMAAGGHGCISVTANIAPRLCAEFHDAFLSGDLTKARIINNHLMPLHKALFCETSPGPVKYAAWRLGICAPDMRLPMAPISETSRRTVDQALEQLKLPRFSRS